VALYAKFTPFLRRLQASSSVATNKQNPHHPPPIHSPSIHSVVSPSTIQPTTDKQTPLDLQLDQLLGRRRRSRRRQMPLQQQQGQQVPTRWSPTPEQLMILEEMYRGGLRTPNASQIQQITAHLASYGRIKGKNVFYWFQNHKARCWNRPSALLPINRRLFCRSTVGDEHL
jgi:hypothetical protein